MTGPKKPPTGDPFEIIQVKLTHNLDGTITIDPGVKGLTSDPFSLLMNLKNLQRILEDHFPKEIQAGYQAVKDMVMQVERESPEIIRDGPLSDTRTPGLPIAPEPVDLSRFVEKKGIN